MVRLYHRAVIPKLMAATQVRVTKMLLMAVELLQKIVQIHLQFWNIEHCRMRKLVVNNKALINEYFYPILVC